MKLNHNSVLILVSINVAMFLLVNHFQLIPSNLFALSFPENSQFSYWQFISYLFMHGSFTHLLFNMFALYSFGSRLESYWGTRRFLIFYFIAGIGAALIYTLVNYYQFNGVLKNLLSLDVSQHQIEAILSTGSVSRELLTHIGETQLAEFYSTFHSPVVGASGAIYGILMAYALIYPNAKLALIFLPFPIKAKYFVPIIIVADLFFGLTKYSIGNIAHFAHLGGALFGLIMVLWWRYNDNQTKNNHSLEL